MGIFGMGNYDKPGKGVDKNTPKKKGFFLFWEIIGRKFMKFLQANSLYAVTSIIWIAFLYFFAMFFVSGNLTDVFQEYAATANIEGVTADEFVSSAVFGFCAMFAVGMFLMWGSGPASAAYSYITRCFTRGDHTWITSDGWDKIKGNFKQGMIVVIIDALVLLLGFNAVYFYYSAYVSGGGLIWMVLCYLCVLLLFIYTMAHPYIYQLMVTFECSVGQLYKNALLLTMGKLPMNFLLTFIEAGLIFLIFIMTSPAIAILFTLILGPCIMRYPMEFYAARVIERSILRDMKKKTPAAKIEYIEEEE